MFRKSESGQAIVILAIVLVVLLAFAALAIDAGNAYTAKRETQNAVDAAVMAGTRQLVLECGRQGLNPGPSESNIRNKTLEMVAVNNVTPSEGSPVQVYYTDANGNRLGANEVGSLGVVPCGCGANTARGIEVVADTNTTSFLAGIIGQSALGVQANARARYGPVANVDSGLYPFTRRDDQPMVFGQLVKVRISDRNEDPSAAPGNFGWLSWNGENNVPNLGESLTYPGDSAIKYYNPGTPENGWTADLNDKLIQVGKWVQGAPGNKNGAAVRAQLDWHIAQQDVMIIPLFDAGYGQGSHYNYRVSSFAGFQLQSYNLTGQDKHMTGKFVKWVTSGDWASGVACDHEGGIYSVKLTP